MYINNTRIKIHLSKNSFSRKDFSTCTRVPSTMEFVKSVEDSSRVSRAAFELVEQGRKVDTVDRDVVADLFQSCCGEFWTNNQNWGSERPLSTWYGVKIDGSGRVVKIDLSNNNLRGFVIYGNYRNETGTHI